MTQQMNEQTFKTDARLAYRQTNLHRITGGRSPARLSSLAALVPLRSMALSAIHSVALQRAFPLTQRPSIGLEFRRTLAPVQLKVKFASILNKLPRRIQIRLRADLTRGLNRSPRNTRRNCSKVRIGAGGAEVVKSQRHSKMAALLLPVRKWSKKSKLQNLHTKKIRNNAYNRAGRQARRGLA